ncbi:MAG: hypothetical protein ACK5OX_11705 [Desertimonas sp.]
MVALAVGAVLIIAAGVFGITRLGDDDANAGGAASPQEAGLALLDALENEDVLGMVDVLLPGERETMRQPMSELVDELRRVEVLSEDASLSQLSGVDIVIDDEAVEVQPTNVDDIANLRVAGAISASVDGEAVPLGDIILDNLPTDADLSELDAETDPEAFDVPITVVEQDGRWYVSLFYSAAEQVRSGFAFDGDDEVSIPTDGVEPTGGDSPENAFDEFLDAISALDLEGMIASLNPNEFEALQRYAPLFLADAQRELDRVALDIRLEEAAYDSSVDGDTASITLTYLGGQLEGGGDVVPFAYEDGCLTIEVPGEGSIDSCELNDEALDTADLPPEAREMLDVFTGLFGDYENPGIIMKRVDGTWFLSPMATGAEQTLAVLRAIDRDEIEDAGRALVDLVEELDAQGLDIDTVFDGGETTTVDTTIVPDDPDTTDFEDSPQADCYRAPDATSAVDCFADLVAQGRLDAQRVPAEMRFPQCGMAEVFWAFGYYELSDAEFVAMVEQANACFQRLVDAGELGEWEIPTDALRPECLEGRNRYVASDEDPDYQDRFYDCLHG